MDKPITLSVRDFLIRKLAVDIMIPEKVIEAVVVHQFSNALNAIPIHNSIEISGLGRFVLYKATLERHLKKLLRVEELSKEDITNEFLSMKKRKFAEVRHKGVLEDIEYIKSKLHED